MVSKIKEFWKTKTFWAGVIIFVCSGVNAFGAGIPVEVILGMLGLEGIFIRHNLKK